MLISAAIFLMARGSGLSVEVAGQPLDRRLSKVMYPAALGPQLFAMDNPRRVVVGLLGEGDMAQVVRDSGAILLSRTKTTAIAIMTNPQLGKAIDRPEVKMVSFGRLINDNSTITSTFRRNLIEVKPQPGPRSPSLQSGGLAKVHLGVAPMSERVTGKGVLVGLIEAEGPDFRHPDFRKPDGRTRFKEFWDMTLPGSGVPGHPYGTLYKEAALNRLLSTRQANSMVFGEAADHPTHSLGILAGNGAVGAKCVGVAPDADIICVATGVNNVQVADAAAFIFNEADRLGKPCVISISMSADHLTGRAENGNDHCAIALSELVEEKPGRVIVASAGNSGNLTFHTSMDAATGKPLWLLPNPGRPAPNYVGSLLFEGESRRTAEFQATLLLVDQRSANEVARTTWLSVDSLRRSGPSEFDLSGTENGISVGLKLSCIPKWDSSTSTQIGLHFPTAKVDPKIGKRLVLQIGLRGSGQVETWSERFLPPVDPTAVQGTLWVPKNLVAPDALRSIAAPASGRSVIAAGAYWDQGSGQITDYTQPGGIYFGEWKPLVCAPVRIPAASALDSPAPEEERVEGGAYAIYEGTSCGSPVLAGAAALYLQLHPKATASDFKRAVIRSARSDKETGPVPNALVGYGKLDFLKLLQR